MIGMTWRRPPEERLEGTLVTTVLAVEKGLHVCPSPRCEGKMSGSHPHGPAILEAE